MKYTEINVLELIPQRYPFVMIDRIVHFQAATIVTALKILPDNIFVDNGVLTEAGIIESIAQTCAARMGYIAKYMESGGENGKIKIGLVGAVKDMVIEKCPLIDSEMTVTVTVVAEIPPVLLVQTQANVGEKTVACGKMTIFLSETDSL
ncbi:MAG: pseudouridylate synthase [Bacteroidales bacterium]|jgi:3-hydroxymyristoyl/3-hydroxydecanoyl-(acyl carrier protein) dehydratase|nr:pseudouridylate synthase [Bacteroidales bacterium]